MRQAIVISQIGASIPAPRHPFQWIAITWIGVIAAAYRVRSGDGGR